MHMSLSVYIHETSPLTLVVYAQQVTNSDLASFADLFRQADIFPLENHGIAILEDGADFSDINFAEARLLAEELERISIGHQQNSYVMPDYVPLVISSFAQRIVLRMWLALTDLTPRLKPAYKIARSPAEALTMLELPQELEIDILNRQNFKILPQTPLDT